MSKSTKIKQNMLQKKRRKYLRLFMLFSFLLFTLLLSIYFTSKTADSNNKSHNQPSNHLPNNHSNKEDTSSVSPNASSDSKKETDNIPKEEISPSPSLSLDPLLDYDYTQPVPSSDTVDLTYFDDALFIGDSRTEGLLLNLNLSQFEAFTHKGLMVNTLFTDPVIEIDNQKLTVLDAMKATPFKKIYIMLGINELGWVYSDQYIEKYGLFIDEIRSVQPDALIYIQSLLPVSQNVSETHDYITNEKINEYNLLLLNLAKDKNVFFLDTFTSVVDESGNLPFDAATDGIHLNKIYCEKWLNYLQTHVIKN